MDIIDQSHSNLPQDGIILRNLKCASYKLSMATLEDRVLAMTSQDSYVFISVSGKGILVFKQTNGQTTFCLQVTGSNKKSVARHLSDCQDVGVSCHELSVSTKWLIYIKDSGGTLSICVHDFAAVTTADSAPLRHMEISHRSPIVVDHGLGLIAIGCAAWSASWTSGTDTENAKGCPAECDVRTLDVDTLSVVREWPAAENSVRLLRRQTTGGRHMLGVADGRTGLRVYDLAKPTDSAYHSLYNVPVEEIRNFHLVGNFVAVFHKFEANVTFWNLDEQKTILCINIQDQLRELAEEYGTEEDDCGLCDDLFDDDHVTTVTSVASDEDYVLLYGTRSGCVFGLSVNNRNKLFNIPCPHESPDTEGASVRCSVLGLRYLPHGKLAVCYEKYGLSVLDFDLKNPPDRPPTRCQKRV